MGTTLRAKINLILSRMKEDQFYTAPELADATGIERTLVCHVMAQMRKAALIHIVEWRHPPGGGMVAMHVIGKGINAPKPFNPKRHEANRLRASRKAREERLARLDAQLAMEKAREIVPFRDPLTTALYGEYQREAA